MPSLADRNRGNHRVASVLAPCLALGAIGLGLPSPAEAHYILDAPACWMSQDAVGGPQKNGPCAAVPNTNLGDVAGTPTNAVTVFQSGQTISVSITVTIAHPGWFRIALAEGASSTQTLTTIPDPVPQAGTNCTPAIMKSPVWSPTQPIIADGLPAGSTASTQQTGNQTFSVTIPASASCSSARPCSLQVIMVMTDHPAGDCYYHHCADISFGAAGTDGGGTTTGGAGTAGGAGKTGSAGTAGSAGTGGSPGLGGSPAGAGGEVPAKSGSGCGCILSSSGGASWAMIATGLVALAMARRRRR
jgi:Lytic polysaccharide mono-oxygenase, cellulose-degrading